MPRPVCCSADPKQVAILNEANKAAAIASAARAPGGSSSTPGGGSTSAAAAGGDDWMCNICRTLNLSFREECSHCRRAHPNPKPKAAGKSMDSSKCPDDEVIGWIKEKHHASINRCFNEAGMSLASGNAHAGGAVGLGCRSGCASWPPAGPQGGAWGDATDVGLGRATRRPRCQLRA